MKILAIRKCDQNRAVIDPWTAVHPSKGLALGLMNVPLRWALTAVIAYELFEQVFERYESGQKLFKTSGPEVPPNALIDTVVFVAGRPFLPLLFVFVGRVFSHEV